MTSQKYLLTHLQFREPQTTQQSDALEHFQGLTPDERTDLLTKMFVEYMMLDKIMESRRRGMKDE